MKKLLIALLIVISAAVYAKAFNFVGWDEGASQVTAAAGAPTLSSATIAASGESISLVFSASVSVGAGGNGGWTLSTGQTMTYSSGSGSTTLVYTIEPEVKTGTVTVSYTQPGDGIEATSGGADVATITNNATTNSSTVLIAQNFETATTGYDNGETWTNDAGSGTRAPASTASPLRGAQNLLLTGNTSGDDFCVESAAITATSPAYMHFMFNGALPADCCPPVLQFWNGATKLGYLKWRDNHTLSAYHGTATADSSLTENTLYHIWVDYTAGSGANGVLDVYIGTTTTKPGATSIHITTGSSTLGVTKVYACNKSITTGYAFKFDQILLKNASFSTVP